MSEKGKLTVDGATMDRAGNTANGHVPQNPTIDYVHGQVDAAIAGPVQFDERKGNMDNSGTNHNSRMENNSENNNEFWAVAAAREVIETFGDDLPLYTCAAGISPSGPVHFGNFRDVMTSLPVMMELQKMGKNARMLFSWDNYDRFRKVPAGIDPSFEKYIGMPLSKVPDPKGEYPSYAARFQAEFEESMKILGIELEYRYQTDEYESGRYDDQIIFALNHREAIAKVLLSFMPDVRKEEKGIVDEEYIRDYYPISIYSKWTGKDNTTVLSFDGQQKITYRCEDTGNEETIDIKKDHIIKLDWKIDWPMRWCEEGVNFEPGGHDHASPGSSFDVSSILVNKVFGRKPPVFRGYQFIGVRGNKGKMSGSKGNAPTPMQLLGIYEPVLLKYLYLCKPYDRPFTFDFGTEIYRIYDELDRAVTELQKRREGGENLNEAHSVSLIMSGADIESGYPKNPIPFRQAASFGSIVQWDFERMMALLKASGLEYDENSVKTRLEKARVWVEVYNPEEAIKLLEEKNSTYASTLDDTAKKYIADLKEKLSAMQSFSVEELTALVYAIPKDTALPDDENKKRQRNFFKAVYNLLIGKDTGPRLGTFLWALEKDKDKVLNLLEL